MNLTQPPFDDVHVRRAVNFVVDRQALRKSRGGIAAGAVATHIAPDDILRNRLKGYAPYGANGTRRPRQGEGRDEALPLRREPRRHLRREGVQRNVYTLTGDSPGRDRGSSRASTQNLKSIGITLKDHVLKDASTPLGTPRLNIPFSTHPGWGKDYADPLTFFSPLFDGRTIYPQGNSNYSLVGITPAIAKRGRRQGLRHGRAERRRRSRPLRRARRRPARHLLRGARQEADDEDRPVGARTCGPRATTSRARTSRSGASTSSAPRRPTPTSP